MHAWPRELPVKASAKGDHGRVLFLESEGTNFKERTRMHETFAKNQFNMNEMEYKVFLWSATHSHTQRRS